MKLGRFNLHGFTFLLLCFTSCCIFVALLVTHLQLRPVKFRHTKKQMIYNHLLLHLIQLFPNEALATFVAAAPVMVIVRKLSLVGYVFIE